MEQETEFNFNPDETAGTMPDHDFPSPAPVDITAPIKDLAAAKVDLVVESLKKYETITSKEVADEALVKLKEAKGVENLIEDKRVELVKPWNLQVNQVNKYAKDLTAKIEAAITKGKAALVEFQNAEKKKIEALTIEARERQLVDLGMEVEQIAGVEFYRYPGTQITFPIGFFPIYDDAKWNESLLELVKQIALHKSAKLEQLSDSDDLLEAFGSEDDKKEVQELKQILSTPSRSIQPVFTPTHKNIKGTTKRWTYQVTNLKEVPREYLMVDHDAITKAVKAGSRSIPGIRIFQDENITLR